MTTNKPTVDEIMELVQGFASTWSLLGGRFDDGSMLEQAERQKAEIRALLSNQPAMPSDAEIDSAFEAVRKQLCALPRYSFIIRESGGVSRVHDKMGSWIEFDQAHALFDPISVDAARRRIAGE